MKKITQEKIDELLAAAKENPRLRTNYNLHEELDDPINRLCIAVMPESKFPVHRHTGKWELLTILYGELTSYIYDDNGNVIEKNLLAAGKTVSLELPPGAWHNLVAHTPTVFLEVKAGPYQPVPPEDMAPFRGMEPED